MVIHPCAFFFGFPTFMEAQDDYFVKILHHYIRYYLKNTTYIELLRGVLNILQ